MLEAVLASADFLNYYLGSPIELTVLNERLRPKVTVIEIPGRRLCCVRG